VLRIADEHRIAFTLRRRFNPLENEREKWIGNIGDRHDQLAGFQRAKIFCSGVRLEPEALDGVQHPAPRGFGDNIGTAEHA